ncbi:hypothetical protein [Massilia sp. TSP1-1-2]|uniref:hypothetical protein n=1 Tax=Massilia sp. TSP1-1-2 TaxID=2804649 RepID=UPI003CED46E4
MSKKDNSQISTLDDAPDVDQAASVVAHVVKGNSHDDALSGDKVNIIIHEQEGEMGREAVFVSVNGVAYQIPRGQVCAVPVEILHVLDNSVQKIFESLPNGETRERSLRRFNHQNHGAA